MLYKPASTEFQRKATGDGRTLVGYASTFGGEPDSYGDIVEAGAFRKTLKDSGPPKTRIKLLYLHSQPLGMPQVLKEDAKGLYFEAKVSKTALGDEVLELVNDGVVDKMSIGYRTIKERFDEKKDIRYLQEVQLFEISALPFPANENADIFGVKDGQAKFGAVAILQTVAQSLGLKMDPRTGLILPASMDTKTVGSFQDLPLLDRAREWDSGEAEGRVRSWAEAEDGPNARYRRAFVWYDAENEENFTAYKLPIADVVDGELFAVPRAIFAAAAAIQGARGGVDIPEDELDAVRSHLDRYYAKMRTEFEDDSIVAPWDEGKSAPPDPATEHKDDPIVQVMTSLKEAGETILAASGTLKTILDTKSEPPGGTPPEPSTDTPKDEGEEEGAEQKGHEEVLEALRKLRKTIE